MPVALRLLESKKLTASSVLAPELAIDIGAMRTVIAQLRFYGSDPSPTGTVTLEHAPLPAEDAFETFMTWNLATVGASSTLSYGGPLRFVRWRVASPTNNPVVSIDLVAREDRAIPGRYFRLQPWTTLSSLASSPQPIEQAVDVLPYRTLVVHSRVALPGDGDNQGFYLQHAGVLDDAAFEDVEFFALSLSTVKVVRNLLRYVRWRGYNSSGATPPPQFLVDVVARGV